MGQSRQRRKTRGDREVQSPREARLSRSRAFVARQVSPEISGLVPRSECVPERVAEPFKSSDHVLSTTISSTSSSSPSPWGRPSTRNKALSAKVPSTKEVADVAVSGTRRRLNLAHEAARLRVHGPRPPRCLETELTQAWTGRGKESPTTVERADRIA